MTGVQTCALPILLYAPLFEARIRSLGAGGAHVNGQRIAQEIIAPLTSRMPVPRQAIYTMAVLLDVQRRFEESSHRPKRLRLRHHDLFAEALVLRRATLRATGRSVDELADWEKLAAEEHAARPLPGRVPETPVPTDETEPFPSEPRRRRRRRRGRRPSETAQPSGEAALALPPQAMQTSLPPPAVSGMLVEWAGGAPDKGPAIT